MDIYAYIVLLRIKLTGYVKAIQWRRLFPVRNPEREQRFKCSVAMILSYYTGIILLVLALPFIIIGVIIWFAKGDID